MAWYLAPSLVALRDEVNGRWPTRDKSSDGSVGDTSHSARPSDHNPDWTAGGVVRAIDVDSNGEPGVTTPIVAAVLKATIGDPRVWYVIWDGFIYSRTYGWVKRQYTGTNPHDHHVHISIQHTKAAETDTTPWLLPPPKPKTLTVATYNMGDGPDEAKAADLDKLGALADVICLQEAGDRHRVVTAWARLNHFNVYWGDGSPGASSVPILFRDDLELRHASTVEAVPATRRVKRKVVNRVRLGRGLNSVHVLNTHFAVRSFFDATPQGLAEFKAHQTRQAAVLTSVVRRRPFGAVLVAGDFNQTPDSPHLAQLQRRTVQRVTEPTHGGRLLDQIWTRRAKVLGSNVLGGLSSDHRAALVSIKKKG